jgi:hypothetical protein
MPIRDDFILRMLDQVGDAIARVLTGRSPGAEQMAEQELASAYQELTGSGRALVARLSSEQLLAILGAPARFNRERGYVLARLLEADAALSETGAERAANGGDDEAAASATASAVASARLKALDLYLEATRAGLDEEDLGERIAGLRDALAELQLPQASHWRIFEYVVGEGRYAAAEDLLFEGLGRFGGDRAVAERGRAFYRSLDALPDADLDAGALPRPEVVEGRAAFEAELARLPRAETS